MNMGRAVLAATLRGARDAIHERGWTQGQYEDADGCLCAVGAIHVAVNGRPQFPSAAAPGSLSWDARDAFCDVVGAVSVAGFNDGDGRRRHQVTDVMAVAAWLADNDPESRWAA